MENNYPSTQKEFDSLSDEKQRDIEINLEKYFVGRDVDEESDLHQQMVKIRKFLPKKSQDNIGNITCQRNRRAIMVFIEKFSSEHMMIPSVTEISLGTGLSRTTIYEHLKSMKQGNHLEEEQMVFDAQIGRFRAIVMNAAVNGNLQAIKLFKELSTMSSLEGNSPNDTSTVDSGSNL